MKLLLDTHIWLWSLLEPERLSKPVSEALSAPDSELWLSSISIWELMVLVDKARVQLGEDFEPWLTRASRIAPLREAPVSHAVVRALQGIQTPHRDPADRFIAATAATLDLTLVTADRNLLRGSGYQVMPN